MYLGSISLTFKSKDNVRTLTVCYLERTKTNEYCVPDAIAYILATELKEGA